MNQLLTSMGASPTPVSDGRDKRSRVNSDGFYDMTNDEHLTESKIKANELKQKPRYVLE